MIRHERMEQDAKEQELDTEYEVSTLDCPFSSPIGHCYASGLCSA